MIESQTNEKKSKYLVLIMDLNFVILNSFWKEFRILRHRTVTYTLQQNDVVERMNMTLLKNVRCILYRSSLPKFFWKEALKTSTSLINKSLSSDIDFQVAKKLWSRKISDYSRLKVFGSTAYFKSEGKPKPRFLKCAFLDYREETKGYRLWVKGRSIKAN